MSIGPVRSVALCAAVLLFASAPVSGQTISTVAGGFLTDGRTALNTSLALPGGVVLDTDGNLIIADTGNSVIRRVNAATNNTLIIAGSGVRLEDSLPIPSAQASIPRPRFVTVDSAGNILFSDLSNRVRKLASNNTVTTIAGDGTVGSFGDGGPAIFAQLNAPLGVALDRQGNLFIGDCSNGVVRKVDASTRTIRTVAGNRTLGYSGDGGPATQASLNCPAGVAVDSSDNLYIVDALNNRLRKVNAQGIITTVMGNGTPALAPDNVVASSAYPLGNPWGVAVDSAGNVYFTERYGRIRRIAATGLVTILAGGGSSNANGIPGPQALVTEALQIFVDSNSNVYFADAGRNLIRRIDASTDLIRTVAGSEDVFDGGTGTQAALSAPSKITFDTFGNLIIADRGHHRLRKLDRVSGIITTIAGTGLPGFSGDGGPAAAAKLNFPTAVIVNQTTGDIVFSDQNNIRIRKISASTGIISTIAGNGVPGSDGDDGPPAQATVYIPEGLAFDSSGNLYFADSGNFTVRKINASNTVISTVAGNRQFGYSGDGGLATAATLSWPVDVAFDPTGNLLIADRYANVVRRVDLTTNQISTIAGTGAFGTSGDGGPALSAHLSGAEGLAVDPNGVIYVSEVFSHVVRKIAANGTITTIAGVAPPSGILGDGELATLATLSFPRGLALDNLGNLFIGDEGHNRIRRVTANLVTPVLAVAPTTLTFNTTQGAAPPSFQQIRVLNSNFVNLTWTVEVLGAGADWLTVSPMAGAAPAAPSINVNPGSKAPGRYEATLVVSSSGAMGSPQTISVVMNVAEASQPVVSLSTLVLPFQGVSGGINPTPQGFVISNAGSGLLSWIASVQTTGVSWFSLSAETGTAPANVLVAVNSGSLVPGVYQGQIRIADQQGSSLAVCVVTLTVTAPAASLLLSQRGLQFTAVEGASALPAQQFTVFNSGRGLLNWSVQPTTNSGGDWLQVSPESGTSDAANLAASPSVTVRPNASGLRAGNYSGLIAVSSPAAANSPQLISVLLRVLPEGSSPPPILDSAGLVFRATAGTTNTDVKNVGLFITGQALSFSAAVSTEDGQSWLSVTPPSGRVQGEGFVAVQVNPSGLPTAAYHGTVTLSFSNGTAVDISVLLVVNSAVATMAGAGGTTGLNCVAQDQYLLATSLGNNFSVPLGFPATLLVAIVDNCGSNVAGAAVSVSFSNGDPTQFLFDNEDGSYSATWAPHSSASGVRLRFRSQHPVLRSATVELSVNLIPSTAPEIYRYGTVNGASFAKFAPSAPGSIISVFGENLAQGVFRSPGLPLEHELGGLSIRVGATDIPLFFTSSGQVNAQMPFDLPQNAQVAMVASVDGLFSTVELVTIAVSQPGIFTLDQGGTGQGAILNGQGVLVDRNAPARTGEFVQVFCTGLGATNPSVPSGVATPEGQLFPAVNPVTSMIGGVDAHVEFAGLSPGFVGLYQVNILIPPGVAPGDSVPLQLFQADQQSNIVTLTIR